MQQAVSEETSEIYNTSEDNEHYGGESAKAGKGGPGMPELAAVLTRQPGWLHS